MSNKQICRNDPVEEQVMPGICLVTRYPWCVGRQVYEVPLQADDVDVLRPRVPNGYSATSFYSNVGARVCVAATAGLANYLARREYATHLGTAVFHRYGYGFNDWIPGLSYAQQMFDALSRQIRDEDEEIARTFDERDKWLELLRKERKIGFTSDIMMEVEGKSFRCACGSNVFHHPLEAPEKYQCNGCGTFWTGE